MNVSPHWLRHDFCQVHIVQWINYNQMTRKSILVVIVSMIFFYLHSECTCNIAFTIDCFITSFSMFQCVDIAEVTLLLKLIQKATKILLKLGTDEQMKLIRSVTSVKITLTFHRLTEFIFIVILTQLKVDPKKPSETPK